MTGTPSIAIPRDASRTVQAAFTAARARVEALERALASTQANVLTPAQRSAATASLDELTARVEVLEALVDTLTVDLAALTTDLTALQAELDALEIVVAGLGTPWRTSSVPWKVPVGETWTVPQFVQAHFSMPPIIDGVWQVDGYAIEMDLSRADVQQPGLMLGGM